MITIPYWFRVDADGSGGSLTRLRLCVFAGALAVALLAVFVIWPSQSAVQLTNDIYNFAQLGQNLIEGNGFRFNEGGRPFGADQAIRP